MAPNKQHLTPDGGMIIVFICIMTILLLATSLQPFPLNRASFNIPIPDQPPPTHYDVLGIFPNATDADIRRAYRVQSLRYHPDKVTYLSPAEKDAASASFEKIQAARDLLLSDARCDYDQDVRGVSPAQLLRCYQQVTVRSRERNEQDLERRREARRERERQRAEMGRRREREREQEREQHAEAMARSPGYLFQRLVVHRDPGFFIWMFDVVYGSAQKWLARLFFRS
ncbi:hypothetical protein F4861DRAFT_205957 [Xylaria intraflava]|nr:hypothetical protein F4861DRAFT_205957 [Xylaria intraflava]